MLRRRAGIGIARAEGFENFFHFHAARSFEEQEIAAGDEWSEELSGFFGRSKEFRLLARMAGFDGRFDKCGGFALHADDPINRGRPVELRFGGVAAAGAMQLG